MLKESECGTTVSLSCPVTIKAENLKPQLLKTPVLWHKNCSDFGNPFVRFANFAVQCLNNLLVLMSKDGETKPSILKLGARHIFVDNH